MRRLLLVFFLSIPPPTFAADGDSAPPMGPTARGLSVEEALQLAVRASEPLGIAAARSLQAEGDVWRARSGFLPQLSVAGSYTRTLASQFDELIDTGSTSSTPMPMETTPALSGLPFARRHIWTASLSGSQTLFAGGRLVGQYRAATAARRSAVLTVTAARAQAMLDAAGAYYDALLADRLLTIAQVTVQQAERTLADVELGRGVGTESDFDLLRARVARDNQLPVVVQRRADRDLALLRLRQLVEIPPGQAIALTTALPDDDDGAEQPSSAASPAAPPGQSLSPEARIPSRQASEAVKLQGGLLDVARSGHWPSLSLASQYAKLAYPDEFLPHWRDFVTNWTVTLTLTLPLFQGGRTIGDVKVAHAGLEEARLRYQQALELAALDTSSAALEQQAAFAAWEASRGTVTQARRAYELAALRFRDGASTQTDLLQARLELAQAQVNRARAARAVEVARLRMRLLPELPLGTSGAATPVEISIGVDPGAPLPASAATGVSGGGASTDPPVTGPPGARTAPATILPGITAPGLSPP